MIEGQFAYVFGVGMVAAFNPCGFAMLPAYLAYFIEVDGHENEATSSLPAIIRALKVGAAMTAGFVVVFTLAWLVIDGLSGAFQDHLSWVTMVIGVGLFALGLSFALGKEVYLRLPHLDRGTESRELGSMFVFGISYALASLSCTIPTFLAAVAFTFDSESFVSGLWALVAYALGMGLVITFLTVCVALAKQGIINRMRGFLPYVGRVAGVLLMIAGAYMVWYGWWEEQTLSNNDVAEGPVGFVTDLSGTVTTWIDQMGAVRLGLLLAGLLAIPLVLAWGWRASRPQVPGNG